MEAVCQDLIAGTVSGCCGIVVGHPLDTVKVRLQARGHAYTSFTQCVATTLRTEGPRGFFKGLAPPLVGNVPINAILFAGYEHGIRVLRKHDGKRYENNKETPLSHVAAAGSYAGLLQCVAMSPTELVKCQMQTNSNVVGGKQMSSMEVTKAIWSKYGMRNGVFRGFYATVLRDVPSCGIYFGVYEGAKRKLNQTIGVHASVPSLVCSIFAGGLAGAALWGSIYPLDLVKSKIQSMSLDVPLAERKLLTVFQNTYKEGGLRVFTKGFGTTIARALPTNAVTLTTYEVFINFLRNTKDDEEVVNTESTMEEKRKRVNIILPHHTEVVYPIYYY